MSHIHRHAETDGGLEVVALYIPADWGVPLAAAIHAAFAGKPGAHFVADLLKIDRLFPPDWHPMQRRERVNRLFAMPVQVGDLVFAIESAPGRMYQKTRRLVAKRGALTESTPTPHSGASMTRAVAPRLNALAVPDAASPPRDDLERIVRDLGEAVRALSARLEGVEVEMLSNGMTLDGAKFQTSEERILGLKKRMSLMERNRRRLEDALKAIHPDLAYTELFPRDDPGAETIEGDEA